MLLWPFQTTKGPGHDLFESDDTYPRGLTPELSRAAKRRRLGRIVRRHLGGGRATLCEIGFPPEAPYAHGGSLHVEPRPLL